MAKKKIFSVEFEWPGEDVEYIPFSSSNSLLDADIILFNPDISEYRYGASEDYQGKPCLNDRDSFKLMEATDHWRRELKSAFDAGKTIIVYLNKVEEIFIATGKNEYSGTGRNRQTTRIVTITSNYKSIPTCLDPVNSKGSSMKLTRESGIISSYWKDFGGESSFLVLLKDDFKNSLVLTKSGDKTVGGIIKGKSSGSIIFLPYFTFSDEKYYAESEESDTGFVWTKTALQAGKKLLSHIIEIDKTVKKDSGHTPTPEWANSSKYLTSIENTIQENLLKIEAKIESLNNEKEGLVSSLNESGVLRYLLYEKGKPLESAIIEALKTIGFEASNFADEESEFDVVFESKEGRLIGEAEGKDSKAINIDKLRQLEMNIHEDFAKDEVESIAKGVLFGNAYRLSALPERADFFTTKCLTAAERSGIALIRTPDLFFVAKYLKDTKDKRFATKCRKEIISTSGKIVSFPSIPEPKKTTIKTIGKDT